MYPMMPMRVVFIAIVACATRTAIALSPEPGADPPLCAIGDLHGDVLHALIALQLCGVLDEDGTLGMLRGEAALFARDLFRFALQLGKVYLLVRQREWKLRRIAA